MEVRELRGQSDGWIDYGDVENIRMRSQRVDEEEGVFFGQQMVVFIRDGVDEW